MNPALSRQVFVALGTKASLVSLILLASVCPGCGEGYSTGGPEPPNPSDGGAGHSGSPGSDAGKDVGVDSRDSAKDTGKDSSDEPGDASEDPPIDHSEPEPHEICPPSSGEGCVQNWPCYTPAKPVPSLNQPRLELLDADMVGHYSMFGGTSYWGGRLAWSGRDSLISYNVAERTWVESDSTFGCPLISQPAARRDEPGGFVAGCFNPMGFSRDFVDGDPLWTTSLPGYIEPSYVILGYLSNMLVHPDGTLYFSSDKGSLNAINPVDGASVWTRELPLTELGYRLNPSSGVGDRLFVGGIGYHKDTGAVVELPNLNGRDLMFMMAAYSQRLIGLDVGPSSARDIVVTDACGEHPWTIPLEDGSVGIVGFDDTLLVSSPYAPPNWMKYYLYSRDGDLLAGPSEPFRPGPTVLGADGVFYFVTCAHGEKLEAVALSPSLDVIARLETGDSCGSDYPFLLDDGQMLIPHPGTGGKGKIVRISTASPGLARTAWPTYARDNARTGWLAAW